MPSGGDGVGANGGTVSSGAATISTSAFTSRAREKARKVAAALSEYAKNAPPIDFKASFDSLEIMEGVMRHFYLRALIEQRMGPQADWSVVDALMLKTLAAAEKVARYRHAQLSAVRLAGDISGKMDDVTLDELLVTISKSGPS